MSVKRVVMQLARRFNHVTEYIVLARPCEADPNVPWGDRYTLRPLVADDIPTLMACWPDDFPGLKSNPGLLQKELRRRFENGVPGFGAWDKDQFLGAVWCKSWEYADTIPPRKAGEVGCEGMNIFLVPEARGKGVSTPLKQLALDGMRRLGTDEYYSLIQPHRASSIAANEKLGYRRLGLLRVGRQVRRIRELRQDFSADTRIAGYPPAIILGSDTPNVVALIRSLGRRGIQCHVVLNVHPRVVHLSRYCTSFTVSPECEGTAGLGQHLISFLESSARAPVLFCCSDHFIERLAAFDEKVLERFTLANDNQLSAEFLDKRVQLEHAATAGINIPPTIFFRTRLELESQLRPDLFPAICKPVDPSRRGSFVHKTLRFESKDDLLARLDEFLVAEDADLMLQRYIGGDDREVLFSLAAVDASMEAPVVVTGAKIRQTPPGAGFMASGETRQIEDLREATLAYLKGSGLRGLVGLEFKRDPSTGRVVFIEISTRSENFHGIAVKAGIDLPYIAYCQALGIPIESRFTPKNVKWVAGLDDLIAARTLVRSRSLTWGQYLRSMSGPRTWSIWDPKDPGPFWGALRNMSQLVAKRLPIRRDREQAPEVRPVTTV